MCEISVLSTQKSRNRHFYVFTENRFYCKTHKKKEQNNFMFERNHIRMEKNLIFIPHVYKQLLLYFLIYCNEEIEFRVLIKIKNKIRKRR